jgi:flagellar hook protein FlgE
MKPFDNRSNPERTLIMIGSMYSAVSGLQSHQTKMDVIGNNIANVNTYGYKSNRATFSDVFYQTRSAASAPGATVGGTNPSQIGFGAKVASIDVIHTRSGAATTSRPLDVYINGDGFIAVKTAEGGARYTRAGVLNIDMAGNLVDRNGNIVLGLPLDSATNNPVLDKDGKASIQDMVPIKLDPTIEYTGIEITQNGEVTALKPGPPTFVPNPNTGWMSGAQSVVPTSLYQGEVVLTVKRGPDTEFMPGEYPSTSAPAMTGPIAGVTFSAAPGSPDLNGRLMLKLTKNTGGDYTCVLSGTHKDGTAFTETQNLLALGGNVTFNDTSLGGSVTIAVADASTSPTTALGIDATVTEQNFTLGTAVATQMTVTGYASQKSGQVVNFNSVTWDKSMGTFTMGDISFSVDPATFGSLRDGAVADMPVGSVGPGTSIPQKLGHLAIVTFANTNALSQEGEEYFVTTLNSGEPKAYVPGMSGTGTLLAGALEMSNVDLSREFTEMIITERGFQANTRMITVSDEMLQELLSMKR